MTKTKKGTFYETLCTISTFLFFDVKFACIGGGLSAVCLQSNTSSDA